MWKKIIFFIVLVSSLISIIILGYSVETSVKQENKKGNNVSEKNILKSDIKEGFNLPLIIIDTKGEKILLDKTIEADLYIYENKEGLNYLQDEFKLHSKIQMKTRGNSTKRVPKKQYNLKLIDENGNNKNEKILGMPKESEWILNAPFEDKSLIRNYMAYSISREIMEYTPKSEYCEVFLVDDGSNLINKRHYKGVFLMIEKIKRGENRVNIGKSESSNEETSFIVQKNRRSGDEILLNNYGYETYMYDYPFKIIYPKNKITDNKLEYINKTISSFERNLYSNKYDDKFLGYENYIDVDTFVDYFIINEFFKNIDAGILSTYIYKDYGEKIKAGPVWDFNASMGNTDYFSPYFDYTGFYMSRTPWFDRLLQDRSFVNKILLRYKILRGTYLSEDYLLNFIDDTVNKLGDAVQRNFDVWPIYVCNQADVFKYSDKYNSDVIGDDPEVVKKFLNDNPDLLKDTINMSNSFEEEIEKLKVFLINRGIWIDKNITKLYKWVD